MNIISFIDSLEKVGVTPEKILAALKEQYKKQQESTRQRVKKHRLINKPVTQVTDVTHVTQSSVTHVTSPSSSPPSLLSPTPPYNSPPSSPTPSCAATRDETFFQKCREYILEKFPLPGLGSSDGSPIHLWQANGYDFERHIKPVVDSKAARGAKPGTFSYFTPAIENATQQKITPAPKPEKSKELSPEEIENQFKWYRKTGIQHKVYNPEGIQANA